jgi:hypothetical protein
VVLCLAGALIVPVNALFGPPKLVGHSCLVFLVNAFLIVFHSAFQLKSIPPPPQGLNGPSTASPVSGNGGSSSAHKDTKGMITSCFLDGCASLISHIYR